MRHQRVWQIICFIQVIIKENIIAFLIGKNILILNLIRQKWEFYVKCVFKYI